MPDIRIKSSGKRISYQIGESLLEILLAQGIFVDNPCNGKGVCGKCRVRIIGGGISGEGVPEPTATEKHLISTADLDQGIRLSCMVKPETDLEIELLQAERKDEVLTGGYVPEFEYDVDIANMVLKSRVSSAAVDSETGTVLGKGVGGAAVDSETETVLDKGIGSAAANSGTGTVLDTEVDGTAVDIETTTFVEKGIYGVAVDIGTTTVVCTLVDMLSGKELAHAAMINAQKQFGLDVLTRITYEVEHPEDGIRKLQQAIVDSLNGMLEDICHQAGVSVEQIYEIAVAANCTMMHMLLSADARPIGKAPYKPLFVESQTLPAADIGIHAATHTKLYCLPSVSAFVGADIVAGAYVCDLRHERGNVLFIDIGTNGEIVLSKNGKLLCCSCAAGPALEGMNISAGVRAAEGAIEDVRITPQGVELKIIGEGTPIGICGSGILAVVKELVKHGIVTKSGAFIKKKKLDETDYRYDMIQMNGTKREFILTGEPEPLLITQGDIRQVQLAKGAILSGFIALLNKAGITMNDLDKVMIAGQFGAHLPADSLTGTGILPREVEDKIVYVGNSSKTGAYMALMSNKVKKEMEELAQHMDYMELAETEGYERLFADCLLFPER